MKTLGQVSSNKIVRDFRKLLKNIIATCWLFTYRGIEIGAAMPNGIPHLKRIAAFGMMMMDFLRGRYKGIHTLIVPSSGNTADGACYFAPVFGLKIIVVMPADSPQAKKDNVTAYPNARLLCPKPGQSVQELAVEEAKKPGCLLMDQYKHIGNMLIHQQVTGPALLRSLGEKAERLCVIAVAMGSGGTPAGVALFFKMVMPWVVVIGVRPKPGHKVDGVRDVHHMDDVVTIPYDFLIDEIVEVDGKESYDMARDELNAVDHLGVGPSSGLAKVGLMQYLDGLSPAGRKRLRGKVAVFLCPDKDTLYNWSKQ